MKKLTITLLAVIFSIGAAISQPISDMGIIPVGITLNSILRLNITNGGSIEYVVNTMDQYTNGVPNGPEYTTSFTVASSVDFDIDLSTDAAAFTGVDDAAAPNTMALGYLGYGLTYDGTGAAADYAFVPAIGAVAPLAAGPISIITGGAGVSAGDINKNAFSILWELGTVNTTNPLLGIASDRYVVNVFLELQGK